MLTLKTYKIVEFDKYAIASYNAVHDTDFEVSDITLIGAEDLEIKDTKKYDYIMTYSFPCQDLSLAGKGSGMAKGDNTRSGLLWEVERLLDEMNERPQILLMENVPMVISKKHLPDFRLWCNKLESLGYKNYFQNLNAKNYGIPQNRNRTFMISLLGDYSYSFPKEVKLKLRLKDFLEVAVDEKYFLSDKMVEGMMNTNFESYKLENKPKIKETENYFHIESMGSIDNSRRAYKIDKHAPTLTTRSENAKIIYPNTLRIRKLTPKECWRLMGFNDEEFDKAKAAGISDAQLYKQAGNSIVVNVLEAIFKELL